jgi:cephalosporin-C deacetylase-like acetyl esterase
MRTIALIAAVALAAPAVAQKQPPPKLPSGDEMADAYLQMRVARLSTHFLGGATNKFEWEQKRSALKEQYFEMLGLWPLPEKTPLHATITGTLEHGDVVIDRLHFQSKPGLYVTGNLYRPKGNDKKLPAILYVCGHSGKGRDGNKTAFQDHGAWFAKHGYVCLVIDTLQLGEVPGVHHGTYGIRNENYAIKRDQVENRWWWHSRGYTPAGVECWNGVRAIDYLLTRSDVDAEKIGVTGISGGGAATIWIAAADERVKVAVPVSGMSDLESYVSNKVINGHCDCMLMINTYNWEWTTIAALIAPRPMLFANSDNDSIFPMDGNRRIIERLRKAYKMYDKLDLVDEYVSKGGHAYRPDLRVAIFSFINKHLKGDASPVQDVDWKDLPGKDLRVFAEDSDLPKDAHNDRIDESFVPLAKVELPGPGQFETWRKDLVARLREKSFRGFPDRIPPAKALNITSDNGSGFFVMTESGWATRVQYEEGDGKKPTVFVVLNDDDPVKGMPKWAEVAFEGDCFLCSPRGQDTTKWTRKNPPNYVERSFPLVGLTVDQTRVYDVIAAFRDFQAQDATRKWQIGGRKQAGVLAAYAALFEPDVAAVTLMDPPSSHHDGPHFLNVMRILDVPEALGLLAPRPLTVHSDDKAFERTAEIYKRAGAADKFKLVPLKK